MKKSKSTNWNPHYNNHSKKRNSLVTVKPKRVSIQLFDLERVALNFPY